MTQNIIERAARAHDKIGWEWYDRTIDIDTPAIVSARNIFYLHQIEATRAAIEAMRVPTPEMEEDGWNTLDFEPTPLSATACWKAMIDGALT